MGFLQDSYLSKFAKELALLAGILTFGCSSNNIDYQSAYEESYEILKSDNRILKLKLEDIAAVNDDPKVKAVVETRYPYSEFRGMLRKRGKLREDYQEAEPLFRKKYYEASEEERKLIHMVHATGVDEEEKVKLKEFYEKHPLGDKEKRELEKLLIWNPEFNDPLSPINRMIFAVDSAIKFSIFH